MTIQELYEWGIKHNAKDLDIEIQYRDGGGYHEGVTDLCEYDLEIQHKKHGNVVVL